MCAPLAKDFRGKQSKQYQLNVVEFHQGKNLNFIKFDIIMNA